MHMQSILKLYQSFFFEILLDFSPLLFTLVLNIHKLLYRVSEAKSIMIGDFGLAGDLYNSARKHSTVRLPVKWMPPESLKDGISNEKTDMVCTVRTLI